MTVYAVVVLIICWPLVRKVLPGGGKETGTPDKTEVSV